MNRERVDILLKYALAVAGQEDPGNREVGPIHLIKYVYLGDLAFSEGNSGDTFTGVEWRFHHFGPWSEAVLDRVKSVTQLTGARERKISSSKFGEIVRWSLADEAILREVEPQVPWLVARAIKKAIHQYGCDTGGLLHHVYRTKPMLRAAPGELLNFGQKERDNATAVEEEHLAVPAVGVPRLSRGERSELVAQIRQRLDEKRSMRAAAPNPPPRYDETYTEGQNWLDSLAGEPIEEIEGRLAFSEDIWKSRGRSESDLS